MAMTETELERLVIRMMVNNEQAIAGWRQAQAEAERAGKNIEHGMKPATHAAHGLAGGARGARHALHILGTLTGFEGLVRPLMMVVHANHLISHAAHGAAASMSTLKIAMIGTGIGVAVAGIAVLGHAYEKMSEEEKVVGEAAKKAFDQVVDGAKSASQAIDAIRLDMMKEQFKELVGKEIKPGFFNAPKIKQDLWSLIFVDKKAKDIREKDFEEGMEDIIRRAKAGQARLAHALANPKVMAFNKEIAGEEAVEKAEEMVKTLEKQAFFAGMNTEEAKRLALVYDLILKGGREVADAEKEASTIMWQMEKAQGEIAKRETVKKIGDMTREIVQQTDRMSMNEEAAKKLAIAQKFVADHGGSVTKAYTMLRPALDDYGEALRAQANAKREAEFTEEDINRTLKAQDAMNDTIQALEDQADKLGIAKEAQDAYGLAQKYAADIGISVEQAIKRNIDQLQRYQAAHDKIAAINLFEKTRTPLEKYSEKMRELNGLLARGALSQDLYNRSVMMTRKEVFGAHDALTKFDAAAAGSAEALSRMAAQREMINPTGIAGTTAAGFGVAPIAISASGVGSAEAATKIEQSNKILGDIRDMIKAGNQKPTVVMPANLAGSTSV